MPITELRDGRLAWLTEAGVWGQQGAAVDQLL